MTKPELVKVQYHYSDDTVRTYLVLPKEVMEANKKGFFKNILFSEYNVHDYYELLQPIGR